jgi:hypothetical protein
VAAPLPDRGRYADFLDKQKQIRNRLNEKLSTDSPLSLRAFGGTSAPAAATAPGGLRFTLPNGGGAAAGASLFSSPGMRGAALKPIAGFMIPPLGKAAGTPGTAAADAAPPTGAAPAAFTPPKFMSFSSPFVAANSNGNSAAAQLWANIKAANAANPQASGAAFFAPFAPAAAAASSPNPVAPKPAAFSFGGGGSDQRAKFIASDSILDKMAPAAAASPQPGVVSTPKPCQDASATPPLNFADLLDNEPKRFFGPETALQQHRRHEAERALAERKRAKTKKRIEAAWLARAKIVTEIDTSKPPTAELKELAFGKRQMIRRRDQQSDEYMDYKDYKADLTAKWQAHKTKILGLARGAAAQ